MSEVVEEIRVMRVEGRDLNELVRDSAIKNMRRLGEIIKFLREKYPKDSERLNNI